MPAAQLKAQKEKKKNKKQYNLKYDALLRFGLRFPSLYGEPLPILREIKGGLLRFNLRVTPSLLGEGDGG